MSDARTLFGEVRSAAHLADADALVASLEAIEALGDVQALGEALAYAHELLWRARARAVAGALRRWAHPDALPMLVWRHVERYTHNGRHLQLCARTPYAPSPWIEGALLELLADASSHVWLGVLALDLPRVHHAALEHPEASVTRAARVPAQVSIAHRRKRAALIRTARLDAAEVSGLVDWADGDLDRLCALSESPNQEVATYSRGALLERLLEVDPVKRVAVCTSHPSARSFARSMGGVVSDPSALARYYAGMSRPDRELYQREVAALLPDCALAALALLEPDADAARVWARRALAVVEHVDDYEALRQEFPDLRVSRELASAAERAWGWMRSGCVDAAIGLLGELPLADRPDLRAALARRAVEALFASSLEPEHVARVAWLPFMFTPLRRVLSRSGTLPAEWAEWRTRTFGLPRDGEEPAERAPAHQSPRRRRGAPKGARAPRRGGEIDEYFEDLAQHEWLTSNAYDPRDYYEDHEPDFELTGGVASGGMVGTTRRDGVGAYLELDRFGAGDVSALEEVLVARSLEWVTTSRIFEGDLEEAGRVCAARGVRFDPGADVRARAIRQGESVCMLDLGDPSWRWDLRAALEDRDRDHEIELTGEVRLEDVAELADLLDALSPGEVIHVNTSRHDLTTAVALLERLEARVHGRTIDVARALMDGEVEPGGRVDLSCTGLTDEDLWLLGRLVTPGELVVSHTEVTGAGLAVLGSEDLYPRLSRVDACGLDVSLEAAHGLLARPGMEHLVITGGYADALEAMSAHDPRLELRARHPRLLAWTLDPVGQAPICFGLSERDLRALAARPELLMIDGLDLRYSSLSPELVEAFLRSPTARNLRTIHLSRVDLDAVTRARPGSDPRVTARLIA